MKDDNVQLKKILKFADKHAAITALFASMIPFIIAMAIMILFTEGNYTDANFLMQHIGIFQVWTTGLIAFLSISLQFTLVISLVFLWNDINHQSWERTIAAGSVTGLALIVLDYKILLAFVVGVLAGSIARWRSKDLKKGQEASRKFTKTFIIFVGFGIAYFALTAYPAVPTSKITLNNGNVLQVKELAVKDGFVIAQNPKNSNLILIKSDTVKEKYICHDNDDQVINNVVGLIEHKHRLILSC